MWNWLPNTISINWLKGIISAAAIGVIAVRIYHPDLKIDAITLGLIVVAILPWLAELIESAKFPGGWEVKFRDVRAAGAKVTSSSPAPQAAPLPEQPSYVIVASHDPNLALVGLRIEIEKCIREFARLHQLDERRSLSQLLRELGRVDELFYD